MRILILTLALVGCTETWVDVGDPCEPAACDFVCVESGGLHGECEPEPHPGWNGWWWDAGCGCYRAGGVP